MELKGCGLPELDITHRQTVGTILAAHAFRHNSRRRKRGPQRDRAVPLGPGSRQHEVPALGCIGAQSGQIIAGRRIQGNRLPWGDGVCAGAWVAVLIGAAKCGGCADNGHAAATLDARIYPHHGTLALDQGRRSCAIRDDGRGVAPRGGRGCHPGLRGLGNLHPQRPQVQVGPGRNRSTIRCAWPPCPAKSQARTRMAWVPAGNSV